MDSKSVLIAGPWGGISGRSATLRMLTHKISYRISAQTFEFFKAG